MDFDVTVDRNNFIGGSDIAVIMGISPFKTRYELLLEKAGIQESDFKGNKFTEYGNIIEPQIREYINQLYKTNFEPNRIIHGDIRCHTDGFNGSCVLEIKSTSNIHESVDDYKIYLVQLLKYMEENNVEDGILAVYNRPDDFNAVFDAKRLSVFEIDINQYKDLLVEVNAAIERFRADLVRLKENPLLSEQDFQPQELVTLSNDVIVFENQLAKLKEIEAQCKKAKQELYEAMVKYGVKSWETPNGTKITRVDGSEPTIESVTVFDEERFANDRPDLYEEYMKTVGKKKAGKSGYVRITLK